MNVQLRNIELIFEPVELHFIGGIYDNEFSKKNNKTVLETLLHPRYQKFRKQVEIKYPSYLNWGLGSFLLELKSKGDEYYLKFLNKHGDLKYSTFYIKDLRFIGKK
jgi:hypothetical protein